MCWRFQTGSNSPLANRKARMLSTDSLPRKWSIRKICDSSKTWCTAWLSSRAEARSVPNGFSMMIAAAALGQPGAAQQGHRGLERHRRDGQMEQPPRAAAEVRLGPPHGRLQRAGAARLARLRAAERQRLGERGPPVPLRLAPAERSHRLPGLLAELVIGDRPPGGADDAVPLRHQAHLGQVEQTRQKFPFGQVAGRAEHHDDMVVWSAAGCPGHGFTAHRLAGLSAPRCW